jgi:hypothetical protein
MRRGNPASTRPYSPFSSLGNPAAGASLAAGRSGVARQSNPGRSGKRSGNPPSLADPADTCRRDVVRLDSTGHVFAVDSIQGAMIADVDGAVLEKSSLAGVARRSRLGRPRRAESRPRDRGRRGREVGRNDTVLMSTARRDQSGFPVARVNR